MTLRAILLGLLGTCSICCFTYFNDAILRQPLFVGSNMPVPIYGGLIFYLLVLSPLLVALFKNLALSGKELAVIISLMLASCCVPGGGLLRIFTTSLMLPHYWVKIQPGWQEDGMIEMIPEQMLADVSQNPDEALNGFIRGLSVGENHIAFSDVPWYAWFETWAFWLPLIMALWVALIGLSVVVHRQWADHEQLPYPIAQFTHLLLPSEDGSAAPIFRNRMFCVAASAVLIFHLNNYAYQWFPRNLVLIPTQISLSSIFDMSDTFMRGPWFSLTEPRIYFTMVALAYFVARDVSLSAGVGGYIYCYVAGILAGYGIPLRSGGLQAVQTETFLVWGAFLGTLLALLYTGRRYYGNVIRRALFLPISDTVESASIWGARVFVAGSVVVVYILGLVGIDLQLAVLYTSIVVMMFLVMGRIIAETGIFFMAPRLYPGAIIVGLFGAQALGTNTLLVLLVLSMVLVLDPRETLMPFMTNSLKLIDLQGVKIGKTALFCGVAVVLGIAVALPLTVYLQYDRGASMSDRWAARRAPQSPFIQTSRVKYRLEAQGQLDKANALSGWERFKHMAPNGPCMIGFGVSLGLVLAFTAARLRFPSWPLHPVMFLIWTTYPGRILAASFLMGWLIKTLVEKYGGAGTIQKGKTLMLGLIAGDMLGGVITMGIGHAYYQITAEIPVSYTILPF